MARHLIGTPDYPLVERMRDSIKVHGLAFCVRYYYKRLPVADARLLLRIAYCGAGV